jgi:cytoskeletal protein CcmA (bactofilin family)
MESQTPGQNVTVISKDAQFEGTLTSKDSIRIDGRLIGQVSSEGTITVGSTGKVEGNLTAKQIITAGVISGGIKASEKVELKGTSRLEGDLLTVRLVIEDGARFEGMCNMGAATGAEATARGTARPQAILDTPADKDGDEKKVDSKNLFNPGTR